MDLVTISSVAGVGLVLLGGVYWCGSIYQKMDQMVSIMEEIKGALHETNREVNDLDRRVTRLEDRLPSP